MFQFLKTRKMLNEYRDELYRLFYMSIVLKNQPGLDPSVAAGKFAEIEIERAKGSGNPELYLRETCAELEDKVEAQNSYLELMADVFRAASSSAMTEDGKVILNPQHIEKAMPVMKKFGESGSEALMSTLKNWLSASLSHEGAIEHGATKAEINDEMNQMRTFLDGDVNEQELRATAIEMVLGDDVVERTFAKHLLVVDFSE